VDQEFAGAVGEVQPHVGRQVARDLPEKTAQIDVDHHHAERLAAFAVGVVDRRRHVQRGPFQAGVRAGFVVDRGFRQIHGAGGQGQRLEHVRVVSLLLQVGGVDAHRQPADAVHPQAFAAMIGGADQAQLQVLRMVAKQALEKQRRVACHQRLQWVIDAAEHPRRLRVPGQHLDVAGSVIEAFGELPVQHPSGDAQALLGGGGQQLAALHVAVIAGESRRQNAGQGQGEADAVEDAEVHGASTRAALSPE
jgi:hypothetical protein